MEALAPGRCFEITVPAQEGGAGAPAAAVTVPTITDPMMQGRCGSALFYQAPLSNLCQHHPNAALPAPSCMRCRTAVPAALLSARRPTLLRTLSHNV